MKSHIANLVAKALDQLVVDGLLDADVVKAPVIERAVAKDRERRFHTAHTLIRALEDVTLRVDGAEDLQPYPGLASFCESDAELFFGREAEVERLWRRLDHPHLVGVVGPSVGIGAWRGSLGPFEPWGPPGLSLRW